MAGARQHARPSLFPSQHNRVAEPTLLHQTAKDSLAQWRYEPGALDGKPVVTHLCVTIQFRR